jgi:hypothetical protein
MEKYSNGTSCLSGELCSVTHPIVSQVNPHVHLFFFAPQGSAGKPVAHRRGKGKGVQTGPSDAHITQLRALGWRGNFLLSAAEQWLKLELTKNFKVCGSCYSFSIFDR